MDKRAVIVQIATAVMKGKDDLAFKLLDDFGKFIWIAAQKDANGFRMDKFGDKGKYPCVTMTPYKK